MFGITIFIFLSGVVGFCIEHGTGKRSLGLAAFLALLAVLTLVKVQG